MVTDPSQDSNLSPPESLSPQENALLQVTRSRLAGIWQLVKGRVQKDTQTLGETLGESLAQLQPPEPIPATLKQWFTVDEAKIRDIIEQVRGEIPTTEAWLMGKPQSGKSSLVRGMTGMGADIVGQGFRPHTQHTQRYTYPSADLPLLIFTDTVGLGDADQDIEAIGAELVQALDAEAHRSRIFILTVKVNDFATATLGAIVQQLRQRYPQIPCLLVLTCLHELYPHREDNHPAYPPEFEGVQRSAQAVAAAFEGLVDRTVWIDFTLEDEGFEPVFYGLEALRETIATLLPDAEAQALQQLLSQDPQWGRQLGGVYRDVARRYVLAFSIMAAAVEAVPLPFASMPVLTTLQISMVTLLGNLYGQNLTPAQAGGLVSTIAGGFLAQSIGRELIKFIPGAGSVIAASWSASYTWALGETACLYFGDLLGGKQPSAEQIQTLMQQSFQSIQAQFQQPFAPEEDPSIPPTHP